MVCYSVATLWCGELRASKDKNSDHNSVQIGLQMDFKSNLKLEY